MAIDFYSDIYNPDVLSCLANLSSDEVFTPPTIANQMLDLLPQELFQNPETKFLDPGCKSGIFLREIAKRLLNGLESLIPDLQQRVDHIFQNQLYGIAITELTSLLSRRGVYCSKYPNSTYSVTRFEDAEGNIRFKRTQHHWKNARCAFCGASQGEYDRGEARETHAYEWLHTIRPEEVFNMNFNVIVGNPPYQLGSDGGTRDIPIYNKFVEQAMKLNPQFLTMIIPSRWMSSGLGLTVFRRSMLNDRHIRKLVDYPDASEVFPGVEVKGGVCYFLWERDNEGLCSVTTIRNKEIIGPVERDLGEYEVFVRDSRSLSILSKVLKKKEPSIIDILSVDKEFGWTSNFDGFRENKKPADVPLYYNRKGKRLVGWIERKEITKSIHLIDTWKVMTPKAGSDGGQKIPDLVLGSSFVVNSPSVCTQTYLFFFLDSKEKAISLNSYLQTKFFRFLVSLRKITQDATRSTYSWVPQQIWDRQWTDQQLYDKYELNEEEIGFIESMIKPMWTNNDNTDK